MIKSALQSSLTNDIKYRSMSAGAVPSSEYLISSTVVGATAVPNVEFSNLGDYHGTYRHLKLVYTARNSSGGVDGLRVRLNGVTASSSYKWHGLRAQNGSIASYPSSADGSMEVGATPNASDTAGAYVAGEIDILDFAHASKNTTIRTLAGNYSANINFIRLHSGLFISTAPVTSITLFGLNGTSFVEGSRFSLYGVV